LTKPNGIKLLAENDSQKAAALQDFFSSVYTLVTNDSFKCPPSKIKANIKQPFDPLLRPTPECIYNKLAELKIDKSPGINFTREFCTRPAML